jgi:hypothetical protein
VGLYNRGWGMDREFRTGSLLGICSEKTLIKKTEKSKKVNTIKQTQFQAKNSTIMKI